MSIYAQVQTYTSCTQKTFTLVLQRYREALAGLGCENTAVLEWISAICWPRTDDDAFGDIYAAPLRLAPTATSSITCAGLEVSIYTTSVVLGIEEPSAWVGFNLLLENEEIKQDSIATYAPGIGGVLWHILNEFARTFNELGAYFTDWWQENLTWRALVESSGDPWNFELGIFPRKLATHFEEVPAGYEGTVVDGAFGFAQANRWIVLPWLEAEQT